MALGALGVAVAIGIAPSLIEPAKRKVKEWWEYPITFQFSDGTVSTLHADGSVTGAEPKFFLAS